MVKKIVVVDIDGTLSDAEWRSQKYLRNSDNQDKKDKDWDSFFEACDQDLPIIPICELVKALSEHYEIVFCTGRRDNTYEKTKKWIEKYVEIVVPRENYLMRDSKVIDHDIHVKPGMLTHYLIKHGDKKVAFIIEDRNSMVKRWRELGYTVLQPQEGDF